MASKKKRIRRYWELLQKQEQRSEDAKEIQQLREMQRAEELQRRSRIWEKEMGRELKEEDASKSETSVKEKIPQIEKEMGEDSKIEIEEIILIPPKKKKKMPKNFSRMKRKTIIKYLDDLDVEYSKYANTTSLRNLLKKTATKMEE